MLYSKIKGMLLSLWRKTKKAYLLIKRFVCFDESQVIYNGKSFKSYWEGLNCINQFSAIGKVRLRMRARREFILRGFRPDEFFLYGLDKHYLVNRNTFLSRQEKDRILVSFYGVNCKTVFDVLKDKYVFYSYLKEFFNRDVVYIKNTDDQSSFLSFCRRHNQIFAKLNKGSCGNGAKMYFICDEEQARAVFTELISFGEWIIEEVIIQDPTISVYNSSSINTIRFPSFKRDGNVKCVFPCMRFGRAGSIVDNALQGGVFVSIDCNTGEIVSNAFDEKGGVFDLHPDSKVPFRGSRIPQWDSLKELVKKAHLALPDNQVYVAFDFALSENGWCLVEGNWGDWILQQVSLEKGLKREFVSLLMGDHCFD